MREYYMECIRGFKPNIGVFNIYGCIVHKKQKGARTFTNYYVHTIKKMDSKTPARK